MEKEQVETIVIGEPRKLNNTDETLMEGIKTLIQELKSSFPSVNITRSNSKVVEGIVNLTKYGMVLIKNVPHRPFSCGIPVSRVNYFHAGHWCPA